MRRLIVALLSVGALSCGDEPPAQPDVATRAQATSATASETSTQRSFSSSYRFAKRPVVVYTAVPPRKPDSFDYEVAFRLTRAIPVRKSGIRGEVLLEEQPNLIKLFRVSKRNNCYTATLSSGEGSAAALIQPVAGQRLRVELRVRGRPADRAEVIATRGSYSLVNNERRQHERYRRLGCYR